MPINQMLDRAQDHGTTLDKQRQRIRCNYCAKVVTGASRLRHHLAGIKRYKVIPCGRIPADLRERIRDALPGKEKQKLVENSNCPSKTKEKQKLAEQSDCPSKTNFINQVLDRTKDHGTALDKQRKRVRCNYCAKVVSGISRLRHHLAGIRHFHVTPCGQVPADLRARLRDALSEQRKQKLVEQSDCPSKTNFIQKLGEPASVCSIVENSKPDNVVSKGQDIHSRLNEIRSSWEITGCSILLNVWNKFGRTLLVFLVDCPQGTMFFKSFDVSDLVENVDTLFSLFEGVVQEVGVENVVQFVTYDNSSTYIEDAGKKLVEKHKSIFWTPCVVHCINLMLEDIGKMDQVRKTLDTAKDITTFTHSHPIAKKLLKIETREIELVRNAQTKSDVLFMLRKVMSEKDNLRSIFSLSAWNTSIWAFTDDGDNVADLVREPLFWVGAEEVLKVTDPLVHVLCLIDDDEKPPMGYIYDAIDEAKEKIKKDLGNEKAKYLPVWTIIDEIWNNQLHSPLHSTGYFLNPAIFYSSHFCGDSEVDSGLTCCIDRMVPDFYIQRYLLSQLDEYRGEQGGFASETAIEQRTKCHPDEWWLSNGGHSPQLQRFAVRILSQTCSSKSERCELIKHLIEELHGAKRRDKKEQQRLSDEVFAHANLVLLSSQPKRHGKKGSSSVEQIEVTSGGENHDNDEASDGVTSIQILEDSLSEAAEEGSDSSL